MRICYFIFLILFSNVVSAEVVLCRNDLYEQNRERVQKRQEMQRRYYLERALSQESAETEADDEQIIDEETDPFL